MYVSPILKTAACSSNIFVNSSIPDNSIQSHLVEISLILNIYINKFNADKVVI